MRPGAVRDSLSAEPGFGAVLTFRGAESKLRQDPPTPGRQSRRGNVLSSGAVAALSPRLLRPGAHNSPQQRMVPTLLRALLLA